MLLLLIFLFFQGLVFFCVFMTLPESLKYNIDISHLIIVQIIVSYLNKGGAAALNVAIFTQYSVLKENI